MSMIDFFKHHRKDLLACQDGGICKLMADGGHCWKQKWMKIKPASDVHTSDSGTE
jgi:hypothetical protein